MPSVGKPTTERDLKEVFEVKLNFVGLHGIGESIERPLRFFFEIFEDRYDPFDSRLIDHTAWSIDQETNVFMKFNIGRKLHCCLASRCSSVRQFGLILGCERLGREPLQRNAEPFRRIFSFFEYSNIDRRVLSDYGM